MSDANLDMNYVDIENAIPHRPPFLLIDRVVDIVPGESATGIKCVSGGEPYFVGHFPGNPVMPGVLIVEALAQTASCLVAKTFPEKTTGMLVFLTTVDKAKFRQPIRPGDRVELKVRKAGGRASLWKFEGEAYVEGKAVASTEFSAMIVPADQ